MSTAAAPRLTNARITLREITADTADAVLALEVGDNQKHFVASNARSVAQAHFNPHAWFRAIYADETLIGFVMLYDPNLSDSPETPFYWVWRFMIDRRYQGMGLGRRAMEAIIAYVKTRSNADRLLLSHVPGDGNPGAFYEKLGFRYTGNVDADGELEMRLNLNDHM